MSTKNALMMIRTLGGCTVLLNFELSVMCNDKH